MKKFIYRSMLAILMVMPLALVSCGSDDNDGDGPEINYEQAIVGSWWMDFVKDGNTYHYVYTFKSDHTGSYSVSLGGSSLTYLANWTIAGDILTFQFTYEKDGKVVVEKNEAKITSITESTLKMIDQYDHSSIVLTKVK